MLSLRHLTYFASFVFILFCSFFLIRDFVKLNDEFSSPKREILKEIWQSHLDQTLDADTTLVLDEIILAIKVSLPERQCPECPACERCAICAACATCEVCDICEACEKKKCPKQKECPVVECEACEKASTEAAFAAKESCSDEKQEISAGDLARQLLVTDWEEAVIPDDAKNVTFEDLPVINNFGKFQRDRTNYDTSRRGYTPRRLVCDELSEHLESTQSSHWTTECTGVPKFPENVISYINFGIPKSIIEKIEKTGMNKTSIKKLSTPYVFLGVDLFDFEESDANFIRMVREAEAQNADIVSGAVVDEHGHWSSHCGHVHVSNYTLDIWDGYYKSIKSIMHCDVGNGPLVVRKELLQELGAEKIPRLAKWPDRLEVLLKLRDRVRFIHCPDCMFYQNENKLKKSDLMRLSRKFKLTNFNFDSNEENFEFTCNEAGIQCGENLYNEKALAQPPCCLKVLTGMNLAIAHEYKTNRLDTCVYCGQVLASVKMPGGQLPWDKNVDMPHDNRMYAEAKKLIAPILDEKYGLHYVEEESEDEQKPVTITHKQTGYTAENYGKHIETYQCGGQVLKGRAETKVKLNGWWFPAPDNPGAYAREYGDEILQHVTHFEGAAYADLEAKFPRCTGTPSHACLEQFHNDGNIQFRRDKLKLFTYV